MIGYSDSDFASYIDSHKSTSGYIFMMAAGAMSWRSVKQTLTATSTWKLSSSFVLRILHMVYGSKVSYLGLCLWIPFLSHLEFSMTIQLLSLWLRNKSGSWSRHINIKYLAVRERVKENKVVIEHVSIKLMIANPLTKGMPPFKFKDHVDKMGLSSTI